MSTQTGKRSDVGSWAATLSHVAVCQPSICCTVGPQWHQSHSRRSAQRHRNEVAHGESEEPFLPPWEHSGSAVRCSSLYPEAKSSGGLGGDSVYRLCTFHELKLLLVNLKRSIRSLRPCCVLIILSDRMACERCLLPPRAVGNSIFLLADRYETCECLISPGGDNDMATSQSA